MSRYEELLTLIDTHKPQTLLEIGVWNGQNAIRMINRAAKHNQHIEYIGYDLFEEATAQTDAVEFNVKGHNQVKAVTAEIRGASPAGTSVMLIKGNTRDTLSNGMVRDFVFLDGGHSIETIASDYERVKGSPVIVLDDYYTRDNDGLGPDTNKYGCNRLVDKLRQDPALTIKLMSKCDYVRGGGYTQLVLVCRQ